MFNVRVKHPDIDTFADAMFETRLSYCKKPFYVECQKVMEYSGLERKGWRAFPPLFILPTKPYVAHILNSEGQKNRSPSQDFDCKVKHLCHLLPYHSAVCEWNWLGDCRNNVSLWKKRI